MNIEGCLAGIAIGDAMGMPIESLSRDAIKSLGSVTGFIDPVQRRIQDTQCLKAGDTTDDWQLTKAVAESLIRRKNFSLIDQALAHIEALETETHGWGGTTRNSILEIKRYFDSRGKEGRSPFSPPGSQPKRGSGNGVAMKIAPIAYMEKCRLNDSLKYHHFHQFGQMTHSDFRASVAAFAVSEAYSIKIERSSVHNLLDKVFLFEKIYSSDIKNNTFSYYLSKLLDNDLLYGPIDNLIDQIGTGCLCTESVVFAIAIFLRAPYNFKSAVLEALNTSGDVDTIASMVGGLVGARVGVKGIPVEWFNFSPTFAQAAELGKKLEEIFTN